MQRKYAPPQWYGEYVHAPTEPTDEHFVVTKFDWNPNQKDVFLVRVSTGGPNFNPPGNPTVFNSNGTYVPGSGQITSLATSARQLQLGVKIIF